ncbi:MAG TPA: GNAT family N-acetyltransferase [Myxococcota bacterium]|nr:GNAT family N-acetyltransferase [Myxococcota bacterium]
MGLTGGCLCGRVRYALRAAPGLAEHCHCGMCHKWHGAAFSTNAELRASALEWHSGEAELIAYRSSPARERVFCRRCGAKLLIRRLDAPDAIALCLATLDGAAETAPSRHVFTADRSPWFEIRDALPCFDVYPGCEVTLRPTALGDLDFVLALERHPENAAFIGRWTRAEHAAAIAAKDREHWLILRAHDGVPLGFLLAFDLRAAGLGVYVKRIAISEKSRGRGREALGRFARRAFDELGASHVWLTVFPDNERAQRSYRALGFAVEPVTPARRAELQAPSGGFSATSLVMVLKSEERRA